MARPRVGALLTRNVFRLVDSFPVAYGVGLVATMVTRNHVRIGDLAAGTLLVYDHTDTRWPTTPISGAPDTNSMHDAEVVTELLQRWESLDGGARRRLAPRSSGIQQRRMTPLCARDLRILRREARRE